MTIGKRTISYLAVFIGIPLYAMTRIQFWLGLAGLAEIIAVGWLAWRTWEWMVI